MSDEASLCEGGPIRRVVAASAWRGHRVYDVLDCGHEAVPRDHDAGVLLWPRRRCRACRQQQREGRAAEAGARAS